ncbi:MAG: hypothetical protein ACKV2U_13775 [Bryobacteraceae bacterium]
MPPRTSAAPAPPTCSRASAKRRTRISGSSKRTCNNRAATHVGGADTAALFTGFSQAADKDLWFVEAHLQ